MTQTQVPREINADVVMSDSSLFADLWQDAEMLEVLVYLRGGVGLLLPDDWRQRLPAERMPRKAHKKR